LLQAVAAVKRTVTVTPVFAAVTGRMRREEARRGDGLLSAESLAVGAAFAGASSAAVLKTRTKVVGFQVLACSAGRMLEGLSAGAVGAMPAFSAVGPQVCHEVLAAWKDGDPALAAEKQERLLHAAGRIEGEFGVAGLKFGCDRNGYFGGSPRLPLLPLRGEDRAEVERGMADLRA
jgi:dihydrodipicolinate synthase/N-acetylneuraminate lyase